MTCVLVSVSRLDIVVLPTCCSALAVQTSRPCLKLSLYDGHDSAAELSVQDLAALC